MLSFQLYSATIIFTTSSAMLWHRIIEGNAESEIKRFLKYILHLHLFDTDTSKKQHKVSKKNKTMPANPNDS